MEKKKSTIGFLDQRDGAKQDRIPGVAEWIACILWLDNYYVVLVSY